MEILIKKISLINPELECDFFSLIQEVSKVPNTLDWNEISKKTARDYLQSFITSINSAVYFIYANKTLVSAGIALREDEAAVIKLLCIHPDYHGKGLGPKMLNLIEQFATSQRLKNIHAKISKVKRIEEFYLRNNFTVSREYYLKNIIT